MMDADEIRLLLQDIRDKKIEIEEGLTRLKKVPYMDLGYAKLDVHREKRVGYPEVIYCPGKTSQQVQTIIRTMMALDSNILATRASEALYEDVRTVCPDAVYNTLAKTITVWKKQMERPDSYIAVVTAGTSDLPVAEEAAITAEIFGNRVERIADVGVAGVHRLFDKLAIIRAARVIIVAAGMEGALPSLIGGLVDKPVIAVPTSVGYGASFQGIAALLSMLNSCAGGVCVVNIDNGFGAGYMASMINKLR
ncbi:MAG TPA: nickel pincer cofactor biosynthesis protein LarB [Smithellaceae bacterium]|nr:nickel pincer cofactor biosynthesis protein LarB [Smithellaceae bacterium]